MIAVEEITQTGRYRKIEEPRNGVSVYEAYDSVLETNVMLREIPVRLGKITSLGQQEAIRDAFAEEAKVFTAIKHESIQRVLDFFSDLDRHCLIMESIPGSDLGELLEKKRGAFPLHDIMNWADQLLDALHYLHTYAPPVFHRNVKPQNLKLTPGGKIKLLACSFTKDTDAPTGSDLNYLSLEQIWNGLDPASQKVITNSYDERSEKLLRQPADARSDIYSVGATLYHLITGCVPIDPLERSIDTLDGKADPLRSAYALDPGVPPEISDVLMRAMEIKRENRYDSAVIMRQVLRTALVRVKERETLDAVKQDEMNAAWEASLAEEKRLGEERSIEEQRHNAIEAERAAAEEEHRLAEQLRLEAEAEKGRLEEERRLTEQRRLELEAEKKRQADLLRQQLREAEEQRSEAQQRAAEAERRLFDKELENFVDKDVIAYFDPVHTSVQPEPVEVEPEPDILEVPAEDFEPRLASDEKELGKKAGQAVNGQKEVEMSRMFSGQKEVEIGGIFAEQKEAGSRWKVPVAILSFVLAGGASFYGVSTFLSSKSTETKQPAAAVISVNDSARPEPASQNSAMPVTETSPAPASMSENPAAEPVPAPANPGQTAPRNKPVAEPAAAVKKPAAAPAKTPAAKKPVTVDDLIKDN
jgi:hypothetical protein